MCEKHCGRRPKTLLRSGLSILQYPDTSSASERFAQTGYLAFSHQKTRGLGLNNMRNHCSKFMTATQDDWMRLSLATTPGWVFSSLQEKHKAWVPKGGNPPQIARRNCSAKKHFIHCVLQHKRHHSPETTQTSKKSITGKCYTVCAV